MTEDSSVDLLSIVPLIMAAVVQSILQAGVTAGPGIVLGRSGVLTAPMIKGLAIVATKVAVPSLLFAKMLSSVTFGLLTHAWPMLFLPCVVVGVGCLVGRLMVAIGRPPAEFRGPAIAAVAFGNSTGMPILLLTVISDTLKQWWLKNRHVEGDLPVYAADPVVYVGIYGMVYPMLQWGVGAWLMMPTGKAVAPASAPAPAPPPPLTTGKDKASPAKKMIFGSLITTPTKAKAAGGGGAPAAPPQVRHVASAECAASADSLDHRLDHHLDLDGQSDAAEAALRGARKAKGRRAAPAPAPASTSRATSGLAQPLLAGDAWLSEATAAEAAAAAAAAPAAPPPLPLETLAAHANSCWRFLRQRVLLPPTCGVLLGLACASVPPVRALLCGDAIGAACPSTDAPLGWVVSGLQRVGDAFIPLQMIILGNALSRGPDWRVLPPRTVLAVVVGKLLLMPCFGVALVLGMHVTIGQRGLSLFDMRPPWDEPFYLAALAMCSTPTANNMMVMTELAGADRTAMATAIFAQYALAPLLLTLTLTTSVVVVLSLNS